MISTNETSGGYVYRIFHHDINVRNSRREFTIVECEYPSLEALCEALRGGPVMVRQLRTQRASEPGTMEIVGAQEMILGPGAVHTAEIPTAWRYVRYED